MAFKHGDPGGSATGGTQQLNAPTSGVTAQTAVNNGQPYAYLFNTGNPAASQSAKSGVGVLQAAGNRISIFGRLPALPATDTSLRALGVTPTGSVTSIFTITIGSDGKLRLYTGGVGTALGAAGASVLSAGANWPRITLSYAITSTTNWSAKVYIDGVLEFTRTNADGTLSSAAPTDIVHLVSGAAGTDFLFYLSDIYVDDTTDQSDPGEWHVTNRKPTTNTTNGFDTIIGSGAVNERPVSTTNGWRHNATSDVDQDYDIEALADGDIDLTGATIGGYIGWVWSALSSATGTPTSKLILAGARTAQVVDPAGTSPVLTTTVVTSATYPDHANGKNIGLSSTTIAADTILYDCGVIVAYIPGATGVTVTPGTVTLSMSALAPTPRIRPLPSAVTMSATIQVVTPRIRTLPSVVVSSLMVQAPTPRVRTLPGAVALAATLQAPRPAIRPTVPVVALTLTPFDPTVLRQNTVTPDAAALVLSLLAATPRIRVLPNAIAATIALQEATPRVRVLPSAVTAALALQAPSPRVRVFPPAVDATLTAFDPTVRKLNTVTPDTVALTLSVLAARPAVVILPDAISALLSVLAARAQLRVLPPATALTMSALAPVPTLRALPAPVTLALTAQAPTPRIRVLPPASALLLTAYDPLAIVDTGVVVTPGVVALTMALLDPRVQARVKPGSVALLTVVPVVTSALGMRPASVALVLTILAPSVAFSAGAELIFQAQIVLGEALAGLQSYALGDELGLVPSVAGDPLSSLTSHATTDALDQAAVSLRTDGL